MDRYASSLSIENSQLKEWICRSIFEELVSIVTDQILEAENDTPMSPKAAKSKKGSA